MFSKTTKYGLRAVIYLALNASKSKKVDVHSVANALEVPQPFLAKILQNLSRAGVINSSKGPGGGFFLSPENKERDLTDVLACFENRNLFDDCVLGLPTCDDTNPCLLHHRVKAYKKGLNQQFKGQTIKELIESVEKGSNNFSV
jgi:Rrf2 family protein